MNEGTWVFCTDPERMLDYLGSRVSVRKLVLFEVACLRRVEQHLRDRRSRAALEVAERYSDGQATEDELIDACAAARAAWTALPVGALSVLVEAVWVAARAASLVASPEIAVVEAAPAAAHYAAWAAGGDASFKVPERAAQAALLRCLFGNPFLPVRPDPAWTAWNDGTVRKLAQAIYDDRVFDRLPLLADALEDAGCDCWEILDHCRKKGPHVRGCWAVDLLLGRK